MQKETAIDDLRQLRIASRRLGRVLSEERDNDLEHCPMDFTLFFFAAQTDGILRAHASASTDYSLELQAARFADEHGFTAVWTPERHFNRCGGVYPNPAVLSAALAVVTKNIQIRAGSVVLPLHNPIRVAEEWALVDRLSGGRVGIAVASGWHKGDFAIAPEAFSKRRETLLERLCCVQDLWAGRALSVEIEPGLHHEVVTQPRPVQCKLPVWLTVSSNPEAWKLAGENGLNVLSAFPESGSLPRNISIYREAWNKAGNIAGRGKVTLMVHTFLAADQKAGRSVAVEPLRNYLRSFVIQQATHSGLNQSKSKHVQDDDDTEALLDVAVEKLLHQGTLIGSVESCLPFVRELANAGVDELACLINFGIEEHTILDGLPRLADLRTACGRRL